MKCNNNVCNNIINKDLFKTNNFHSFSLKLTNIAENKNNRDSSNIENKYKTVGTAAADSGCTSHFIMHKRYK